MKALRRTSGLWAYLENMGKTDASGEELKALRREYRRAYMKAYKQSERRRNRHYTLTFKRAETEGIRKTAKEHRLTENAFLKKAVFAYLTTSFVVRDKIVLDQILQALLRCQATIQQVQDRDKGGWFKGDRDYEGLSKALSKMTKEVTDAFSNPPRLHEEILSALANNPNFIETLRQIVKDNDSKVIHEGN